MSDGEDVWRRETPHVLTALLRRHDSFEDCEDAVQEALLAAATQWPSGQLPDNPRAWLIRVASRKLIDASRSEGAQLRRMERVGRLDRVDAPPETPPSSVDQDDTLQMLLLCAHPALTDTSRVALTLRAVSGLSTRRIATLLLTPESTVAQRISRAKTTIRSHGLRLQPPTAVDLPERLNAVRHVLYLTYTAGHTTDQGAQLVDDTLVQEAIWLTSRLHRALPDDTETVGLLALMMLGHARGVTRVDSDGNLVPLAEQDRSRWDRDEIDAAVRLVEHSLANGPVGPFQLQAAIAAVHAEARTAADTDWLQITMLYRMLDRVVPSAAVSLNLAAAIGMAHGPQAGLEAMRSLSQDPAQAMNHRVFATRAHLLELAGDWAGARADFERAAVLTQSIPEQRYLHAKAAGLANS